MTKLIIDGQPLEAAPGATVLETALAHGIDIPRLCYHPELAPSGGCRFERTQRQMSAVTIPVNPETEAQIKAMINRFRKEIIALAGKDPQTTHVIQLNFQLFPLTERNS